MKKPSHRNPETLGILRDAKDAIRNPCAWPGGYPKTGICDDGGLLCPSCMEDNWTGVCHDTLKGWNTGWRILSVDIVWEGGNHCSHCGKCVDAYPSSEKGAML